MQEGIIEEARIALIVERCLVNWIRTSITIAKLRLADLWELSKGNWKTNKAYRGGKA